DSWRITQYSRVPEDLAHFPKTVPKCTITLTVPTASAGSTQFDPNGPYERNVLFKGNRVLFTDFLCHWAQYMRKIDRSARDLEYRYDCLGIHLDQHAIDDCKKSNPW